LIPLVSGESIRERPQGVPGKGLAFAESWRSATGFVPGKNGSEREGRGRKSKVFLEGRGTGDQTLPSPRAIKKELAGNRPGKIPITRKIR